MTNTIGARRQAAEAVMRQFAAKHGSAGEWREEDQGDRIALIGTATDGREYAIAYAKESA